MKIGRYNKISLVKQKAQNCGIFTLICRLENLYSNVTIPIANFDGGQASENDSTRRV